MYYIAYGSNLNLLEMKKRVNFFEVVGSFLLENYKLSFKGYNTGFLTLEYEKGALTPVGIFKVTEYGMKKLDYYEGYPRFYDKCVMNININGRVEPAFIYIMNKEFDYKIPLMEYILRCKQGYKDFNFDESYLDNALNYSINMTENAKNR